MTSLLKGRKTQTNKQTIYEPIYFEVLPHRNAKRGHEKSPPRHIIHTQLLRMRVMLFVIAKTKPEATAAYI